MTNDWSTKNLLTIALHLPCLPLPSHITYPVVAAISNTAADGAHKGNNKIYDWTTKELLTIPCGYAGVRPAHLHPPLIGRNLPCGVRPASPTSWALLEATMSTLSLNSPSFCRGLYFNILIWFCIVVQKWCMISLYIVLPPLTYYITRHAMVHTVPIMWPFASVLQEARTENPTPYFSDIYDIS